MKMALRENAQQRTLSQTLPLQTPLFGFPSRKRVGAIACKFRYNVCARVCVCVCARARVCVCVCVCVRVRAHACVHACVCARGRACPCVRACVCMCVFLYVSLPSPPDLPCPVQFQSRNSPARPHMNSSRIDPLTPAMKSTPHTPIPTLKQLLDLTLGPSPRPSQPSEVIGFLTLC